MDNEKIFFALKHFLKKKNISYKTFSEKMGLSESGLKKLMMQEDCSISKLLQMCQLLDLELKDLIAMSEVIQSTSLTLNEEQNHFFIKNPNCYYFFLSLIRFDYNLNQVLEILHIDLHLAKKFLIKLLRLNLILMPSENEILPRYRNIDGLKISPELSKIVSIPIFEKILKCAQEKKESGFKKWETQYRVDFDLTEKSALEFKLAMNELMIEFQKRSKREKLLFDKNELRHITNLNILIDGFLWEHYLELY